MIIFVGEISLAGSTVKSAPPTMVVKNGEWKAFSTQQAHIYTCDFSPKKTNILENEYLLSAISGQPVINGVGAEKAVQLQYIANALTQEKFDLLSNANGVFGGYVFEKHNGVVHLFTDYLGFRQIYLYRANGRLIFSNAHWLIQSRINENLTLNSDSVVELGTLGYPLANRTRFNEIELLPPGQVMSIGPEGQIHHHQYFDLTKTQPATISEDEAVVELHEIWKTAVKERSVAKTQAFGFLSGGMDSRLLVHTLKSLDIEVYTANFAPLKTRDRVFGEMAANALNVRHFQHPNGSMFSDVLSETIEIWQGSHSDHQFFSDDPYIWSGDGGSVGLGHVYLTDEITRLAGTSQFEACAEVWCRSNNRHVPNRLYRDKTTEPRFQQRIRCLLESYGSVNPSRAPYYFLMLNDQRRHLDRHYEIFHKRGVDFHLPFFDKRLISFVASLPPEWGNLHRQYDKLYQKISGNINITPWQTYPGHVACLLPYSSDLKNQWGNDFHAAHEENIKVNRDAIFCAKMALTKNFPDKIFNRNYVLISALATLIKIVDRSYLRHFIESGLNTQLSMRCSDD